jgi:hypothetical protein
VESLLECNGEEEVKERGVVVGGEVLKVGSTVVVLDGRRSNICEIKKVGRSRLYVRWNGRDQPFSVETRQLCSGGTVGIPPHFQTHTERKDADERHELTDRLRSLGFTAGGGGILRGTLSAYPIEVLKELIAVLEKYQPGEN